MQDVIAGSADNPFNGNQRVRRTVSAGDALHAQIHGHCAFSTGIVNNVGAITSVNNVGAAAASQGIVACAAAQCIVACDAYDAVVAVTAIERVIGGVSCDRVAML